MSHYFFIGSTARLVIIDSSMLLQTEECTSEQRKPHRCQDSSGNEDKLEKYIRRYVISSNRILVVFIELLCVILYFSRLNANCSV